MKAVAFRALAGAGNSARQVFSTTRNAIPENRITTFLQDAMTETVHALKMTDAFTHVDGDNPISAQLKIEIIVGDAGDSLVE